MSSFKKYKNYMTEFEAQLRSAKYVSVGGRPSISSEYIYNLDNIINNGNPNSMENVVELIYELKLTKETFIEIEKIVSSEPRNNEGQISELFASAKKKQDDAEKIKEPKKKKLVEIEQKAKEDEDEKVVDDEDDDEESGVVKMKTKAKKKAATKTNNAKKKK